MDKKKTAAAAKNNSLIHFPEHRILGDLTKRFARHYKHTFGKRFKPGLKRKHTGTATAPAKTRKGRPAKGSRKKASNMEAEYDRKTRTPRAKKVSTMETDYEVRKSSRLAGKSAEVIALPEKKSRRGKKALSAIQEDNMENDGMTNMVAMPAAMPASKPVNMNNRTTMASKPTNIHDGKKRYISTRKSKFMKYMFGHNIPKIVRKSAKTAKNNNKYSNMNFNSL